MKMRVPILIFSLITGTLSLLGACLFAVGGAGIYGSPFSGNDIYFVATLLLVLLFGPFSVLPCTMVDWWKPGRGGVLLCGLAIAEVGLITLNNIREWGFAIHDAALGSLCIAFPMFVIGTLLFHSGKAHRSWLNLIWWTELLFAAVVSVYFLYQVGADGVFFLIHLLS